jgi:hypothetical protein
MTTPLAARLQNSHQNGGRVFLIFVADPNRTVVQDLGRCFVIRAIVEALTVPWTARLLEVELDKDAEQLIDELADV